MLGIKISISHNLEKSNKENRNRQEIFDKMKKAWQNKVGKDGLGALFLFVCAVIIK